MASMTTAFLPTHVCATTNEGLTHTSLPKTEPPTVGKSHLDTVRKCTGDSGQESSRGDVQVSGLKGTDQCRSHHVTGWHSPHLGTEDQGHRPAHSPKYP